MLPADHDLNSPAVSFEVPLEMLSSCHRRVQRQFSALLCLTAHLRTPGPVRTAMRIWRKVASPREPRA